MGKIELERAQRAAVAEKLQALVVGEAGVLDLLALGDVDDQALDVLDAVALAVYLDAETLDPEKVAEPVAHAELDVERAGAGGAAPADLVGRRGGVVGVDQVEPGGVGVG